MLNRAFHRPVCAEGFRGCVLRQAANACDLSPDIDQPYANGARWHSKNPDGLAFDVGAQQRVQAFARSVVDVFADRLLQPLERAHIWTQAKGRAGCDIDKDIHVRTGARFVRARASRTGTAPPRRNPAARARLLSVLQSHHRGACYQYMPKGVIFQSCVGVQF